MIRLLANFIPKTSAFPNPIRKGSFVRCYSHYTIIAAGERDVETEVDLNNNNENYNSNKAHSPFGKNSPFSMGIQTNSADFRNIQNTLNSNRNNRRRQTLITSTSEQSSRKNPQSTIQLQQKSYDKDESLTLKKELQSFRIQQAESLQTPLGRIFNDECLDEICKVVPATEEELLQIKGIGPKKLEMFGPRILNIVSSFQDNSLAIESKPKQNNDDEGDDHTNKKVRKTQLKKDLKDYRVQQAEGKPIYQVFTNAALEGIYALLPTTKESLLDVKGIGPKKVDMFGDDILAIVSKYVDTSTLDDVNGENAPSENIVPRRSWIDPESLSAEQYEAAKVALGSDRKNVFITGSAGTGKSYVLKYLEQELRNQVNDEGEPRRVGICAPTGVAAIIVGGNTLHSFFGIGLGNGSLNTLVTKVRKNSAAKKRIDETDILIIDECSMLSSDLLEKLDSITREIRQDGKFKNKSFGGMQIIFFGDFFQLPPVEKIKDRGSYRSFCFDSYVWSELGLSENTIQLKEIIRQDDKVFVSLLNKVRVGQVNESDIRYLNSKCLISEANPLPKDGIVPTRLYVLNRDVDEENTSSLAKLNSKEIVCHAVDIWRQAMPLGTTATVKKQMRESLAMEMPDELKLKVGAQVMLTRNKDLGSNLVNGSRGVIERFYDDGDFLIPVVRFDNGIVTSVPPVESVRYNSDGGEGCLVRKQVPLKLAWAITVHKSQGSTLSRALLDLTSAFEYGQCYVALSRVKSLDGLWLQRPAKLNNIKVSQQVKDFFT